MKEVKNICSHFVEKNSFRGVARETKHSLNAVYRVADKVGKHCEKIDEEFLVELDLDMVEADDNKMEFYFLKKCLIFCYILRLFPSGIGVIFL